VERMRSRRSIDSVFMATTVAPETNGYNFI
jgi:hypothetical protein